MDLYPSHPIPWILAPLSYFPHNLTAAKCFNPPPKRRRFAHGIDPSQSSPFYLSIPPNPLQGSIQTQFLSLKPPSFSLKQKVTHSFASSPSISAIIHTSPSPCHPTLHNRLNAIIALQHVQKQSRRKISRDYYSNISPA